MPLFVFRLLYNLLKFFGFSVVWEISAGAVVFREEKRGRVYLLLHYLSGHFDFPKGHIESGETEEIAVRRETEEETGICDIKIFSKRVSISYFYAAKGRERKKRLKAGQGVWIFKQAHFCPAQTQTREVKISHEHIGFVWLSYKEALSKVTFENARRVLMETEEYLSIYKEH